MQPVDQSFGSPRRTATLGSIRPPCIPLPHSRSRKASANGWRLSDSILGRIKLPTTAIRPAERVLIALAGQGRAGLIGVPPGVRSRKAAV